MGTPSLRDVQQWMQARIQPATAEDAARTAPDLLQPQRGTPGLERMSVYAEGYVARMREALADMYPAVAHVIGERRFTQLAESYAQQRPSQDYNLSLAGRHLPEFLPSVAVTAEWPFLPDLARLEWLVSQAFHAALRPPVSATQLTGLDPLQWEQARLVFQPTVARVASAWPILDIWQARAMPLHDIKIELVNRPQRVLVCRQGLEVRCAPLDEAQDGLLAGLLAGKTLGSACEELAAREQRAVPDVGEWFSRWMAAGLITDVMLT